MYEYLEAARVEAPGLIEGLYLVGSVALNDFRPQSSDIDFVAVTDKRPKARELAALDRVHYRLRKRRRQPYFDGIYVTWDELTRAPVQGVPGPSSHDNRFYASAQGEWNPVTWHTLTQQGVRCHGPEMTELTIWNDVAVLAAWTNDNLDNYWRWWLARGEQLFTRDGAAHLTAWACAWCVLGVSRLHYTLATGEITSKEGAGVYALGVFPAKWHRITEEALRIRRANRERSSYGNLLARRRDAHAFSHMVIEDAHRLYLQPAP